MKSGTRVTKLSVNKWAGMLLTGAFVGMLAAFPFQHTFVGGFLFAMSSAAAIGGLADWFAVTALFGQPLRVKWPDWMGTNIISRNRERLINELVHMVQTELLSIPNIRARLDEHNIGAVLLNYLTEHHGEKAVNDILQRLAGDVLAKADLKDLASVVQNYLLDHADAVQVSEIIADVGEWTLRNRYDDRIVEFFAAELVKLVRSPSFRLIAERLIDSALQSYEKGMSRRKWVNSAAGLSAPAISAKLQSWLTGYLEEMSDADNPHRIQLKQMIEQYVHRLRTDQHLRDRIEAGKMKLVDSLKGHIHVDAYISENLESFRQAAASGTTGVSGAFPWITNKLRQTVDHMENKPEMLDRIDQTIKTKLYAIIEQKHDYIGKLVKDKLGTYSEEELIKQVKEHAGRDLQYVRINGTLVGAFIGAVLYLLTYVVERVTSSLGG
ncbi:DUF445 domain-containing protein [Paenibacillus harenae]|uniref:DUF445 domain-containing protein n=1 Tax=Paenibacillus harenae TaxID=306543 RepID=UPI00278CCE7B|nr:DUF445 domain-containing protein [Paenibacillus harenae]MDQ0061418.1 uncharacterized membrane-anchored protein YjiN (DUF445 family) [Paenibacillus harenae]